MKSTLLFQKLCLVGFLFVSLNVEGQCTSEASNDADSKIDIVQLTGNSINLNNNSSTSVCVTRTEFYTGVDIPDLIRGNTYTLNITQGTCNGEYNRYANAWIDYDNNNDFTGGNEALSNGTSSNSTADFIHSFIFTVPMTATLGNRKMRIILIEGSSNLTDPCISYTFGETEEYWVDIIDPISNPYCSSAPSSNIDSKIDNIKLIANSITLNNSTIGTSCNRYSDFTSGQNIPDLVRGVAYTVEITQGTCGTDFDRFANAWIDYNKDYDFVDASEMLGTGTTFSNVDGYTHTYTFTVPTTATLGQTRMRTTISEASITDPCSNGSYQWGETEDYTVNIIAIAATPMTYTSSTVTQNNTSDVLTCSENQEIIGIQIVTSGTTSPLAATMFRIKTNGSTNSRILTNVSNVDIYYTGTNSTFAPTTHFGNKPPEFTGVAVDITGSQTLAEGTNYFWVVYDINTSANIGDLIDARCNKISFGGVIPIQDPTIPNPSVNRTIVACAKPGGLGTKNLTAWWEPDGLTNGNLTSWSTTHPIGSQIISVTDDAAPYSQVTETPADGIFNYRKVIDFNGNSGSNLKILKTTAGIDLLKNQNAGDKGTFFVVYAQPSSGASDGVITYKNGSDGVQMRGWGRIAIGAGDDHNGARDFTPSINRKQMLVSYKGNKSSPTSMSAMKDGSIQSTTFESSALMVTGLTLGAKQMSPSVYGEYFSGYLSETIFYNVDLSDAEINRVNSYLAIKYGITLGTTATPISYNSSLGTTIWAGNSAYQRNIIGIGKDQNSNLLQKQSHQFDDSVRIYKGNLNTPNSGNPSTFANDRSFVVMGASTGRLCATDNSNTELPPGLGLFSKLEREWRITRTNMNETFNIDIRLAGCGIPGSVDISDLRFLVDTDDNFANGNTVAYAHGSSSGFAISYASGTISVKGISTTHIPNNATRFFTIGSIKSATPLPVELTEFSSNCESRFVNLKWTTASETNNDFFTIEKSTDGYDFETSALIDGQGNKSTASNYEYHAFDRQMGISYYRLSQTDFDGTVEILKTISSNCSGDFEISIYPNPTKEGVFVSLNSSAEKEFEIFIYNLLGKEISSHKINGSTYVPLPYASGVYLFKYKINGIEKIERIVKQ
ncbi:T9SS type A sorting domain-containing protein [Brumimicrobium glaciale]|uniref:T9SS type A sorting domain-containing protein n=1 Tax=Brumimicrobium glaciale TaxID=200475 RepID=A0A4Q4KNZ4_9FLAO|nr:GEVED domain-containing protein [Brumimicrobium glaciale]RYM35165.1 T9SS type A sorting domain-containing protein [Brumimicrobium glaciale]